MTARFVFVFLCVAVSVFAQPRKPNFSGAWQFDEAQSTYKQTTKVIKDVPDRLKAKIPSHDAPRLFEPPRFFIEPPVLVIKHIGVRLSFSSPSSFSGWIPWEKVWLVDGKERINRQFGIARSVVRWHGNRIVREWKDEERAGVHNQSEGREIFTLSDDGKTLTYDMQGKYVMRTDVDGRPYELEDYAETHTVLLKKR